MRVGQNTDRSGFFSQAQYMRGVTPDILEKRLGFKAGRLSAGWYLLFLRELPLAKEYEFRAYTHMSGGVEQGHLENPIDPRTAEQRLKDDGYNVPKMKQRVIDDVFTLKGHKRLAKVHPVEWPSGKDDYPQGSGIPQWTLNVPKPFVVKAFLNPGEVWLGDYLD